MSSPNGSTHHDQPHLNITGAANGHHDTSSQHNSAIHDVSPIHHNPIHQDAIDHHNTTNQQRRLTNGAPPAGDPFAVAHEYYGPDGPAARREPKLRTQSQIIPSGSHPLALDLPIQPRRGSVDEQGERYFQVNNVDAMYKRLLHQEDTDGNGQITVEDVGPKTIQIGTYASRGLKYTDVRGTYVLSNLLQELTLAKEQGRETAIIPAARITENPVDRLSRFIRDQFWTNLTRRIDGGNVLEVASDPKDWTANPRPRIYVPPGAPEQYAYYQGIAEKQRQEQESAGGSVEHHKILDVQWLAKDVTPEYIRDLNGAPGLLAVGMDEVTDEKGHKTLQGKPFIVPGGRFNEFYGWDSYMGSLGLIIHKRIDICKSMVENFTFCIQHYGKILNANRSYYLGRSQPPFLTDMVLRVWDQIPHDEAGLDFIRKGTLAAIKEYFNVWMAEPRLDHVTGLSRYRPIGVGVPPETESTHFLHVLEPYAKKHGLEYQEFVKRYNSREILEPDLDEYFLHDRAVRESGHDTSYRLEGLAANLATIDLNSCLFKIESDIARIIRFVFNDKLPVPPEFQTAGQLPGHIESSSAWERRWKKRRVAMDKYMWDEERGMYLDYDTVKKERTIYESATTFWAMWSGVATPRQAAHMVIKALPKFEMHGGLVSGTLESRGNVGLHRPNRQWDYPFAWAPHQILAWNGMQRYGYIEEAQRLAYRWCHMVTNAFQQFNGIVVEKYDLTRTFDPQRVEAEYGNQGADFKGVPKEGFGWVNASYIVGIDLLTTHQKKVLGTNVDWEAFSKTVDSEIYSEEGVAAGSGFPEQAAAERGLQQNYIGPYGTGSGHVGHAREHVGSNGRH